MRSGNRRLVRIGRGECRVTDDQAVERQDRGHALDDRLVEHPAGPLQRLLPVGAGDNVVRLLPPLIVTEAEIEEGVQRLERACAALSGDQSKRAAL